MLKGVINCSEKLLKGAINYIMVIEKERRVCIENT